MGTPLALALLGLSTGCISVRIGPDDEFFKAKGLANVYGSVNGLDGWDGSLLDIGILTNTRGRGELVSVEVGPIAGAGVGLVGARARVLPLEFGAGSLFYNPRPRRPVAPPELEEPAEPLEPIEPGELGEPGVGESPGAPAVDAATGSRRPPGSPD